MSTVEERLASLEARVDAMTDLRTLIVDMRNDMTRQFAEMRADMTRQFAEMRADMGELRREMRRIDDKHDRHFTWLVGLQMTLMVAVIGVLVGAYYR